MVQRLCGFSRLRPLADRLSQRGCASVMSGFVPLSCRSKARISLALQQQFVCRTKASYKVIHRLFIAVPPFVVEADFRRGRNCVHRRRHHRQQSTAVPSSP